ncbi:MAG: class I SAM-dependent methyltransferase [Planctomycetia bacterium]
MTRRFSWIERVVGVLIALAAVNGFARAAEEPAGFAPGDVLVPADADAAYETAPKYELRDDHDPDGTGKFFMDREIAHVMGHLGAGWLERPEREREEQPTKLLDVMKLKPGMVVADIGAGSGYFTFRMAERVAPDGKVLAVDIQPEMLQILRDRKKELNAETVEPLLGTITDPNLPEGEVDVVLMVDVYHEFSHPWEMTRAMVKGLKPGGRIVFVEYRLEDPAVPIKLVHKMREKQVVREMSVHGLRWVGTVGVLPRQHIVIFEKPTPKTDDAEN